MRVCSSLANCSHYGWGGEGRTLQTGSLWLDCTPRSACSDDCNLSAVCAQLSAYSSYVTVFCTGGKISYFLPLSEAAGTSPRNYKEET